MNVPIFSQIKTLFTDVRNVINNLLFYIWMNRNGILPFVEAAAYSEGDICVYKFTPYMFKEAKSAGAWDSTKVVAVRPMMMQVQDRAWLYSIGEVFSPSEVYYEGDYVFKKEYRNYHAEAVYVLYRCTATHIGDWDDNDFTITTITDELKRLSPL